MKMILFGTPKSINVSITHTSLNVVMYLNFLHVQKCYSQFRTLIKTVYEKLLASSFALLGHMMVIRIR